MVSSQGFFTQRPMTFPNIPSNEIPPPRISRRMLSSIPFPSMVPGMFRKLLLAALLCPLAFAESPKPPATLAELKANPAGLTACSGDIREAYGQYPVTGVYVRETDRGQVSYLLYGDKVFGYLFRFQKAGDDTQLWHDGINAFLDATFPADTFQRQNYSVSSFNNIRVRTQAVLNTKAYDEAMQGYQKAEDGRLRGLLTGSGAGAAADATAVEKEKNPAPGASRTLADYLKSFPDTKPAVFENEAVAGFEHFMSSLDGLPHDALHRRKAGEAELLIVSRKGMIIAYLVMYPLVSSSSLEHETRRAGLAAAFPDSLFSQDDSPSNYGFYVCLIKDRAAFAAAREAYLAEEAAKVKALLNP